ncbi:MAG: diguanylate cyclase [Bdellovibrionaceae bacterium]|nr:diguanylate cyclase [Pseudobdellovibrionaceae bacterium]MDW8189588.1 diguanylate cyclase [Pseudobdellovibrionaceae bacterium]
MKSMLPLEEAIGVVLDDALDSVVILDPEDKLVFVNEAFERLVGKSRKRILGKTIHSVLPITSSQQSDTRNILMDDQLREVEVFINGSASLFAIQTKTYPFLPNRRVTVLRDVSLERRLHQQYKTQLQEKEQLIAQLDRKIGELQVLVEVLNTSLSDVNADQNVIKITQLLQKQYFVHGLIILEFDQKPKADTILFSHGFSLSDSAVNVWMEYLDKQSWEPTEGKKIIEPFFDKEADIYHFAYLGKNYFWYLFGLLVTKEAAGKFLSHFDFLNVLLQQWSVIVENQSLYLSSITDPKTQLYNQRYFHHKLKSEIARSRRYKSVFCLVLIDLDYFKQVNDHFGHQEGDLFLIHVAKLLRQNFRNVDIICRIGGDEFAVILPHTNVEGAQISVERLYQLGKDHPYVTQQGKKIPVSFSIGIGEFPTYGADEESLFQVTDQALYQAKNAGRGWYRVFSLPLNTGMT